MSLNILGVALNILPYSSKRIPLEWRWRQSYECRSALGACYHSENNLFPPNEAEWMD